MDASGTTPSGQGLARAAGRTQDGAVVQVDEGGQQKHAAVLRNVGNLLDDFDGALTVELVAHGEGIELCLAEGPLAGTVQGLIARGVTVAACEHSLEASGIDRAQLVAGVVTVPAGIGEVVRRQQGGWAYVRP